ncbi:MAG: family 16 glycosylhydrolase [Paludibacter sp.]
MKKIFIAAYLVFISIFASAQDYKLMWEDNFDNPVLNQTQHWNVEVNGDGGGNNELQYYRRENLTIEQDVSGVNCLVISAKKENFGGKVATSGRLSTRTNVSCKYGKIEARIKLPHTANGLWPAFWMLGDDFSTVGWPRCGEIDILEMGAAAGISQAKQDKFMDGACHWGEVWTYNSYDATASYGVQDDFHLYTLIWDSLAVKMYLDLDKYPTVLPYYQLTIAGTNQIGDKSYYFHKPFNILLNLAVGGTFTGITGNSNLSKITALPTDGTPAKMWVDYVRIYQQGGKGEIFNGPSTIVDTELPTAFTATKGAVTPNSVELLMNATDNSGNVIYYVTYGTSSFSVKGTSGVQTSYIVNGLNSSTNYNFSVVAKDLNGNAAVNNPITISATTGISYNGVSTIDYETVGKDWTWTLFGNGDNASSLYSVAANPNSTGINLSANCAKYTVNTGAMSWAGLYSDNIGSITFTADNCKVKVMVYKTFISNFDLKFENGATNFEILVPNTKINQWEELNFDLTSHIGQTITRLTLIPDFSTDRSVQRISYWDNLSFNSNKTNAVINPIDSSIQLYPNPFNDRIKIKSEHQINQVIIHDLLGQNIKINNVNSLEANIDLSELAAGNYFATIKLVDGRICTEKIVKL